MGERIDNFNAMHRKAVFGFMTRLGKSSNCVVSALFDSDLAYYSSVRKAWSAALHTYACYGNTLLDFVSVNKEISLKRNLSLSL